MTKLPIKGFMVGNGVTNWYYDTNPTLPATLGGFDMTPNRWLDAFEQGICRVSFKGVVTGDDVTFCTDLWNKMSESIPAGILNPYDLYRTIPDENQ